MAGNDEFELTFYAEVTKPEGYQQALARENHEQWEHRVTKEDGSSLGKERVRKTWKDGPDARYELTIKLDIPGNDGLARCQEKTVPITEEYFEAWKKLFGTIGSEKVRYTYLSQNVELEVKGETVQLPEVAYEVDVLVNGEGRRSKWAKIDIEVDKILKHLEERYPDIGPLDVTVKLSSLPLGLENAFSSHSKDPEHQATIRRFWEGFGHRLGATAET